MGRCGDVAPDPHGASYRSAALTPARPVDGVYASPVVRSARARQASTAVGAPSAWIHRPALSSALLKLVDLAVGDGRG